MPRPPRLPSPARFAATYGPWAVVTGASSGIGRACADVLAATGLDVVLVARNRTSLDAVAAELTARHGVRALVVPADLATGAGVDAVHAATEPLDVGLLVAAAGFGSAGDFLDADEGAELQMVDVNCRAVLAMSLHAGRRLAARGRGGLVLMSSLVGFQGAPGAASYAATKAYVQTLAEGLHAELGRHGVHVLASAPGPVHSGFAERAGMTMGLALEPTDVAVATLRALGRRTTVAPGALSKALTWSLAPLPRAARTAVMGRVMAGLTRTDRADRADRGSRPVAAR